MKDHIHALHDFFDSGTVLHARLGEADVKWFQICPESGPEIVENADVVCRMEVLYNVAANEPGSAGDEDTHAGISGSRCMEERKKRQEKQCGVNFWLREGVRTWESN
jgi:hypothetical protein